MFFANRPLIFQKSINKIALFLLALVSLGLTSCLNVQSNIALHGQGNWHGIAAIQLSSEFVQMMEEGSTEASADTADLDKFIQQAQEAANRSDLNVTFNQVEGDDGSLNYLLQADGQDLNTLNETFFEGDANISVNEVNGRREITIRADMSDNDEGDQPATAEELEMMKAFGLGFTFRISGGEIISSNATRVEGGTAIWEFPSHIEVTLTEADTFNPDAIALQEMPSGTFSLSALETIMDDFETTGVAPSGETVTDNPIVTSDTAMAQENSAMPVIDETIADPTIAADLPTSGAILPQQTHLILVLLAAMTIGALAVGAAVALRK